MRKYSIKIAIPALTCLVLGASTLAMAANNTNQQSSVEKPPPRAECQITEAAQDAINGAMLGLTKAGNVPEAQELLSAAERAGNPPECDSGIAEALANMAKSLAENSLNEKDTVSTELPKPPKLTDCEFFKVVATEWILTVSTAPEASTASTTIVCPALYTINKSEYEDEITTMRMQQYRFIAITRDNLFKDMARGEGEYVNAMAALQGCPAGVHGQYAKITKYNFKRVFPTPEVDTETILLNLEAQIATDPLLAARCNS